MQADLWKKGSRLREARHLRVGMTDEIAVDALAHLAAAVTSLAAFNKLLLLVSFGFALIALLLAGLCGYFAGRHHSNKTGQVFTLDIHAYMRCTYRMRAF